MARGAAALPSGAAGRLLGAGLWLGVAAGAAWVTGKALGERASRDEAQNPRLINWEWARTIARRAATGIGDSETSAEEEERARREYAALVERSAGLVSRYTGIELPAP